MERLSNPTFLLIVSEYFRELTVGASSGNRVVFRSETIARAVLEAFKQKCHQILPVDLMEQ